MRKILTLLMLGTFAVSSFVITGCENKDKLSKNNKEKIMNVSLPKEKEQNIDLDIYFDSSSSDKKASIAKEERLIHKEELIGELIMQELIKGPSVESQLKPILPKETRLISFSIKDEIAYVNLSKDAKVSMTATKEEACLKSIASSLTELSSIKKIKILIENKDTDIFGGNYDVSKPFGKDEIDGRKK